MRNQDASKIREESREYDDRNAFEEGAHFGYKLGQHYGEEIKWVKSSDKMPPFNVGVLVFIPEEDHYITVGMWDVSRKWVLLDEYRVPQSEVTYWAELPAEPDDKSYVPCRYVERTTTEIIRDLQKENYYYKSLSEAADEVFKITDQHPAGQVAEYYEAMKRHDELKKRKP